MSRVSRELLMKLYWLSRTALGLPVEPLVNMVMVGVLLSPTGAKSLSASLNSRGILRSSAYSTPSCIIYFAAANSSCGSTSTAMAPINCSAKKLRMVRTSREADSRTSSPALTPAPFSCADMFFIMRKDCNTVYECASSKMNLSCGRSAAKARK